MKGHVGDGARSGELKAPDTGKLMPCLKQVSAKYHFVGIADMSFVSITFDKCRYRLPKFGAAVGGSLWLVPWYS